MTKTTKSNGAKAATKPNQSRNRTRDRTVNAPASMGSIITPSQFSMQTVSEGVVRFRGHELLGQLQTIAPALPGPSGGTIAGVFDLNPACWRDSRLSRIAATYEKYRYDAFTIRYHPTVPTTAPNAIATYVELEIDEDAATTVVQALNHQYAAMGPAWGPHQVHYKRPPQDPKAYFLTDQAAGNRSDMSQGKIVSVSSGPGPQAFGYLSIEYDVIFMYPELEAGFPGTQFLKSTATVGIIAPGGVINTAPVWNSVNVKAAEIVLEQDLLNVESPVGSAFNFLAGAVLYTGWDGISWKLYKSLENALNSVYPLVSNPGLAAFSLNYLVRQLTKAT